MYVNVVSWINVISTVMFKRTRIKYEFFNNTNYEQNIDIPPFTKIKQSPCPVK